MHQFYDILDDIRKSHLPTGRVFPEKYTSRLKAYQEMLDRLYGITPETQSKKAIRSQKSAAPETHEYYNLLPNYIRQKK